MPGDSRWPGRLTVEETDGSPSARGVYKIKVDPASMTLTNLGSGAVEIASTGGGGGVSDGDKGDITVSGGGTIWTVDSGAVSIAEIANIATDRLVGRDSAGAGPPEELTVGGGLEFTGAGGVQRSALTGDVTAAAGGSATTIANNAVSFSKMQDIATDRLIGRDTAGTGDPEELTVGGGLEFTGAGGVQRSALTGDVTATAGSGTTTIANNAVSFAKLQDVSTDRLIGRDTAGAGDAEELTVGGGLEFTGSGGVQRSALTGDVTAAAGSGTTTIANDAVSLAKMADMATASVIGRSTAGTGDPEIIAVQAPLTITGLALDFDETAALGNNARVTIRKNSGSDVGTRRRINFIEGSNVTLTIADDSGSEEVDVTIASSGGGGVSDGDKGDITVSGGGTTWTIDNGVVTFAKMQDVSADRLIGRGNGGGSGAPQEITLGTNLSMSGTTLNAAAGAAGNTGTAEIDFGAFPGSTHATVAITGQTSIVAGSIVHAWIRPSTTTDHSSDEHIMAPLDIIAADIVAGTGFTVHGVVRERAEPLEFGGIAKFRSAAATVYGYTAPSVGGRAHRLHGRFAIAWRWS
jgi:hypothetical protein